MSVRRAFIAGTIAATTSLLWACDRRQDTAAGGPVVSESPDPASRVIEQPVIVPAEVEIPAVRTDDVPIAGSWQGRIECDAVESVADPTKSESPEMRTTTNRHAHVLALGCDESGVPKSITLMGFPPSKDRVISIGEPGTSQTIEEALQIGDLELHVTVDSIEYTPNSAKVSLSGVIVLDGRNMQQNGSFTQVVTAEVVDGKLDIQITSDYQVTATVAVIGDLPMSRSVSCRQTIGRR